VLQVRSNHGIAGVHYPAALPVPDTGFTYTTPPATDIVGRTNYLPMGGYLFNTQPAEQYKGLYTWKSAVKMAAIKDGTSNTIAFVESLGGWATIGANSGWIQSSWVTGIAWANYGTCPDTTNGNCRFPPTFPQGRGLSANQPGSFHSGGRFNVCFGD